MEGFHSTRLWGVAAKDLLGTAILALVSAGIFTALVWPWPHDEDVGLAVASIFITILVSFILWMLLAMGLHLLFGVDTEINRRIFGPWASEGRPNN